MSWLKIVSIPLSRFSELSLSARILVGLGLGIFLGLFFGELASVLEPIGDIYIRLLQVTVVPYLVCALVLAFGQMDASHARRLAVRAGTMLLLVWGLTTVVIAAIPFAFPVYESASFFSEALVAPRESFSLVDLYFTTNPFSSLSNNVIPAVVLFSSMVGISLIRIEGKEKVLSVLRVVNGAIGRITTFVLELTPFGVLAVAANAAGTTDPETLERLVVYFVAFAAASLVLALWILPLLVTAVTPFRYGEVVSVASEALVTAFVVSNAFVVLPLLAERSKQLMSKHGVLNSESESAAEVLIPILFNFPNAGRLLTLLFIPYAAWLAGDPLTIGRYSQLFAVGIPSYFAKAQVALPFLLDLFGLPHDLFHLYLPTAIITGKFDSMVTAMNLLVFALVGAAAMGGFLVIQKRRVLRAGILIMAGVAAVVVISSGLISRLVDTSYRMDEALENMHASRASPSFVYVDLESATRELTPFEGTPLDRVKSRGVLRVGYDPVNLPFSFLNAAGELVGFDVELAIDLAEAIGVRAEFVPVKWNAVPELLGDGTIDVMPGMWYRPNWLTVVLLSKPYLSGSMGIAVLDHRRHEFDSVSKIQKARHLKIGIPLDARQIKTSAERYFGRSDAEFVTLEFWDQFFEGKHPELDAFLMPAEHAAAWTLLYPKYSVVVPQPDPVTIPTGFGLANGSADLLAVVDEWTVFATTSGVVDSARRYWILGQGASQPKPRWSIIRDLLGWVDQSGIDEQR